MKRQILLFVVGTWLAAGIPGGWAAESAKSQTPEPPKPAAAARKLPVQNVLDRDKSEVEVVADQLEYSRPNKKIIAKGNAVLTHGGVKITADYAEVQTESKQAFAKGHVFIFHGEAVAAKGDEVYYDFKKHAGQFPDARVITEPWYATGKKSDQIKEGVIQIQDGCLTSCYEEDPGYKLTAKKMTIKTGDKMIARNVTLYILDKPVFWFPYLVVPLNYKNAPLAVNPGYSSEMGAYVLTSVGYGINPQLTGKVLADWRSLRGVGGGAILDYDYGAIFQGQITGYLTQDKRAPTPGNDNPYESREDRTRGRLTVRHRTNFDDHTHIIARYHNASDEFVLRDFFHKEERIETEQHSFVALTHNTEHYGLLVDASKKINDYEAMVEKLPEVRLDWRNQPFLRDGLFYESRSSFANIANLYGRSTRVEDVTRFDTRHIWTAPLKWNEFKFTPYLGNRGTYYSRLRNSQDADVRLAFEYGADLRTHFYKTHSVEFSKLGVEVNNLRHVVEPSVALNSVHSTLGNYNLHQFDSVDKLDSPDVVTLGLENRLQTKRVVNGKMQRVDIVSLNTFLIFETHPEGAKDRANFTSFAPELVLRPYNWLQYQARANFDPRRSELQVFNEDLIVRLSRARFLFGHRYVKNPNAVSTAGVIDTSNQVLFEASYQLSKIWRLAGYIRFDAADANLEQWQVVATRELGCQWVLDLGYSVSSSAISQSNKEIFANLRMRGFPRYDLRTGSRATFSEPRIGETVAGANEYGAADAPEYYFNPYQ